MSNISPTITPPMRSSPRASFQSSSNFSVTDTRRMFAQRAVIVNGSPARTDSPGSPNRGRNGAGRSSPTLAAARGGSPTSPTTGGSLVQRLQSEVYQQRPIQMLRDDIDMIQQFEEKETREKEGRSKWAAKHKPAGLSPDRQIYHLKCLVVESERYQRKRRMDSLKVAVVLRAVNTMGPNCPPNYYRDHEASDVLFNDIDTLMTMPLDQLPDCGPVVFAMKEVYSFPLWHQLAGPAGPRTPEVEPISMQDGSEGAQQQQPRRSGRSPRPAQLATEPPAVGPGHQQQQ